MILFEKYTNEDPELANEYFRFLTLKSIAKDVDNTLVAASKKVEQIWRRHVLDTKAYKRDCLALFNAHFDYKKWTNAAEQAKVYKKTLSMYATHFGMDAPPAYWPRPVSKEPMWTRSMSRRKKQDLANGLVDILVKENKHGVEFRLRARQQCSIGRLTEKIIDIIMERTGEPDHVLRVLMGGVRVCSGSDTTVAEHFRDLNNVVVYILYEQCGC